MRAPSVAVVVPLLDEAGNLPGLLHDLAGCDADEIVLVDGGSGDASVRLLAASGMRWLQTAAGRAAQMNAGAAACTADVLLFLHADTRLHAQHLAAVRHAMRDACVAGGRFDLRLSGRHAALRLVEGMINLRSRLSRISTGDQAMFVRRSVFEDMSGFADMPLMEDVEFSRRLKRRGDIACLRRRVTTSSRRWERRGIVRTVLLMWRLRWLFWLGTPADRLALMYRDAR